ncbi:MAG: hypothetical protein H6744_14415 [Deltaproteobacteria bacterium]|nr:hypothetical protein [Deltaproteobacteria bacterium]MCB9787874.1 hypothetical protein [Deltaproteobacteria bacterium]
MVSRQRWRGAVAAALFAGLALGASAGWAAEAPTPAPAPKTETKPGDAERPKPETWPRRVEKPAQGTSAYVVQQALIIAQEPDARAAFRRYLELMHPDWKHNDKAIRQLEAFSWQRFRRQAKDYVLEGTEGGFLMTRQDPEHLGEGDDDVRIFLQPVNSKIREQPTPIRLRRHEGAWLITANSL